MDGAAYWGAFYRYNPDKFAEDYLHLKLKKFQKILLVMMFWSTIFVLIACRGLGKTFLSAIYCVIRCILYPGTKVCIASGTRGQAINVLEKIMYELKPASPELCAEIDEKQSKVNGTNAQIVFFNTSVIKVVTASDSARGNRCHVLLLDEYRLISKDTIDTVLRKFLTLRRMPRYEELTDEQRKEEYAKEKNLTMYLSSAYFKDHWSYTKCVDTLRAMTDSQRHQFVCGFPYQLSISEGLLDAETVADEMAESDFSDIKFSMEMCAEFYGSADGAFFDFDSISKNRRIKYPMLPDRLSSKLNSQLLKIPQKQNGEVRLLSADIALMSSRRNNNDATAIFINQLIPTKAGRYSSNIVYAASCEGLRTDDQALMVRKLFDEYACDYIVLDANGIGLGVFDALARDIVDTDTGEIYPALSCCNNQEMASRCTVPGAAKVIWAIKASAQFNSDCAFLLREGFRSGRVRLLMNEYDADELLDSIKGYASLNPGEKMQLKLPYINTTLLIDELVNLQHEESGGKVKIFEKSGARKDRYSSLSYSNYVAIQLENKLGKRFGVNTQASDMFVIKPPSYTGKAVNMTGARGKQTTWY
jgi:hypothetical protein